MSVPLGLTRAPSRSASPAFVRSPPSPHRSFDLHPVHFSNATTDIGESRTVRNPMQSRVSRLACLMSHTPSPTRAPRITFSTLKRLIGSCDSAPFVPSTRHRNHANLHLHHQA